MTRVEGRGMLLQCGTDSPRSGWMAASGLDGHIPFRSAPWDALPQVAAFSGLLPGGLSLIWDLPGNALEGLGQDLTAAFWALLFHLPGVDLHLFSPEPLEHLRGPARVWLHAAQPPTGDAGAQWRKGWFGWVPGAVEGAWALPGFGRVESIQDARWGFLWGEVVMPLGALKEIPIEDVARRLSDAQASIERNLSQRLSARAWPEPFPFLRRRASWRLSVLGGREFVSAGGLWEEAAHLLRGWKESLAEALRCPVHIGSCHDPEVASLLGHQAMREGFPWRYSLPLPPASPAFTPGLAADPRDASPLEFRAAYPEALAGLFSDPSPCWLRVPHIPPEAAVTAFLRGLGHPPALWWLPPEVVPPGPFLHEHPWAPVSAYLSVPDVTQALQPGLFDSLGDPEESPAP